MATFHFTGEAARGCDLGEAFALRAWQAENNPWVAMKAVGGGGYVGQEMERLMGEG